MQFAGGQLQPQQPDAVAVPGSSSDSSSSSDDDDDDDDDAASEGGTKPASKSFFGEWEFEF